MNYRRGKRKGIFGNTVCASSTDPVILEAKRERERKKKRCCVLQKRFGLCNYGHIPDSE